MRFVVVVLGCLAVWMALVLYVAHPWPDSRIFAAFFLAIGFFKVVTHKASGRRLFARSQASPPFVARVWAIAGERGVQALFLGIGIIFILAGILIALRLV
ncbi:MAG TPA: hypothetical protein VKB49_20990 [Candidatus Sulfotelmatobacter sp.]|nr:hypothetical protein [Candidatus Sulfotelmatobacter sp.]